jgi:hypothetical protein
VVRQGRLIQPTGKAEQFDLEKFLKLLLTGAN